ncbi:hypothetical protein SUGI_0981730 [Cryptomeria japonica]|uniref:uncharacterized protein LOC131069418 n=1 Tax=Cryptomeria japonica TaxID=3369 RepID=UPI002414B454|nr:uncharacterized protein LOC131069418 [Cryptomeria japonica]GLJ46584.1 hypothetical protein SUGI_0981730 [Cryptomeria japonica]
MAAPLVQARVQGLRGAIRGVGVRVPVPAGVLVQAPAVPLQEAVEALDLALVSALALALALALVSVSALVPARVLVQVLVSDPGRQSVILLKRTAETIKETAVYAVDRMY